MRSAHLRTHAAEEDLARKGRCIATVVLQTLAQELPLLEAAEDLPLRAILAYSDDVDGEGAARAARTQTSSEQEHV